MLSPLRPLYHYRAQDPKDSRRKRYAPRKCEQIFQNLPVTKHALNRGDRDQCMFGHRSHKMCPAMVACYETSGEMIPVLYAQTTQGAPTVYGCLWLFVRVSMDARGMEPFRLPPWIIPQDEQCRLSQLMIPLHCASFGI